MKIEVLLEILSCVNLILSLSGAKELILPFCFVSLYIFAILILLATATFNFLSAVSGNFVESGW